MSLDVEEWTVDIITFQTLHCVQLAKLKLWS